MNRFLKIIISLFFLPLGLYAQKEDFQPPKLNQKSHQVHKAEVKKKVESKRYVPANNKKKNKNNIYKDSHTKSVAPRQTTPQDTISTPGFIKYIPRNRDASY